MPLTSVELFAGAGGLALGTSLAGVKHKAVIEWNKWACDTIRENQNLKHPFVVDWPLYEGDVRKYDFSNLGQIDLVTGGPPCQPFSLGGKHKGYDDQRDMFPTAINVIRKLKPKAFLIENVKGLARGAFANYLQYTLLQLSYPEILKKTNESWIEHLARLEKEKISGNLSNLLYKVVFRVINAADYGVPQRRERLFIVGFRYDLDISWSFPKPTHSLDALLYEQCISGFYWEKHEIIDKNKPNFDVKYQHRVEKLRNICPGMLTIPWVTVRDALDGLPAPYEDKWWCHSEKKVFKNHEFQPGAKFYAGHTGSPLDLPAKTIKAGAHGVPGGENMLVGENGKPRYFTIRESARLQCFPDSYIFQGSWTESMRQLGNAVPVNLAYIMVSTIVDALKKLSWQ